MAGIQNRDGELAVIAATKGINIVPDDETQISPEGVALYVGTGGDLKVKLKNSGNALVFKNVPDGSFLPILVTHVYDTDTTAADIIALY